MKSLSLVFVLATGLTACGSPPPAATATAPATTTGATITPTTSSPEALAHFRKGEVLFDNLRIAEASAEFEQALKLDANFQLAHALHGLSTPGPEGLQEIEAAAAAAAGLAEPERLLVEGAAATRRGDFAKAVAAYERVTVLAPGEWRGFFALGQEQLNGQKLAEASAALKKAAELNPGAGGVQNMLGYAALRQGDATGAIAAFEQYARIMPQEPNPQDSLGEALLAAGRFKEAEAAFQKALAISPEFWAAHEGIAYARLYAGDWKGGREALAQAKAAATRVTDQLGIDDELAAVAVAQRDSKGALAILDAMEKTTSARPSDIAIVPVRRAQVFNDGGRYREALAPAAAALATADGGHVTSGLARNLRRQALRARIVAESGLRDVAAATTTAGALDKGAADAPDDPFAQTAMHFGQGMLALAKGDTAGARTHFAQCSPDDQGCAWQAVVTAEKAGDTAGAASARALALKTWLRDPVHLVVRTRLSVPAKSS
jgi:tetratricopeptide (TPR) repeat protein